MAHINTTLQRVSDAYFTSVSIPNPLIQFQIEKLFDSIMTIIPSTTPPDIPSEEPPSVYPTSAPIVSTKAETKSLIETYPYELTSEELLTVTDPGPRAPPSGDTSSLT